MFKNLEKFFNASETEAKQNPDLEIAAAVLFLEMASADFEVLTEEQEQINKTLSNFFHLDKNDVDSLIAEASKYRQNRNDIWYFTNIIKKDFSREQKKSMLEELWQLIYADGRVDKFEDVLIRKMTSLLGLDHSDMITAKIKAREKNI